MRVAKRMVTEEAGRPQDLLATESAILAAVRSALNATDQCRVIRNSVGFDSEHNVRYGIGTGSADLIGILRCGHAFAVEIKTQRGQLSSDQRAWWLAFRKWGGLGGIARSEDEALELLHRALAMCMCEMHRIRT